jgi:hypothetical protein
MGQVIENCLADRSLKSCGSLPVFHKTGDTALTFALRSSTVFALRATGIFLTGKMSRKLRLPKFVLPHGEPSHWVIKSIAALGRAGLLLRSVPDCRVLLIIRDPLGQVRSRLYGITHKKFERATFDGQWFDKRWLHSPQADRHELTEDRLYQMTLVEQLAWDWTIFNEKAVDDINDSARCRIIRYDDLRRNPIQETRDLFSFADLPFTRETEDFINRSTNYHGSAGYYQVYRDLGRIEDEGRPKLSPDDEARILAILRQSRLSQFWPDLVGRS